jgi:AcrR family transcriptional regulator
MAATYQTIATAIRERIESGRLRPGDRVPSTREITRQWGVAIATATKALAALQTDGLVRGVVGVGTVVADRLPETAPAQPARSAEARLPPPAAVQPRRRPATEAEPDLTRDRIIRTAVAVADAEGMTALTMRRLATELDVAVMSLYRHVSNKDDLMVLMADHVLGEAVHLEAMPAAWRARIEAVARAFWRVMKAHPWLPSVMSLVRPPMVPNGMTNTERIMRTVRDLGFDAPTALYVAVSIAGLLVGVGSSVQLELEAQRETGLTSDQFMQAQADVFTDLARERFPTLFEASSIPGFDLSLDDIYEYGVGLMLDGLAQRIPAQKSRRSSRSMPRSAS